MAQKLNPKEIVSVEEVILAQAIEQEVLWGKYGENMEVEPPYF